MARRWTASEVSMLRELASDGYTDAEIADELNERFGTTRNGRAVCVHRHEAGIPTSSRTGRSPNHVRRSQIMTFLADGRTLAWIARKAGVSKPTVNEIVSRLEADGLVERTGGSTSNVRYRVTLKWIRGNDDD